MVPLRHSGAMAGREEENPWSREGIRRQQEELEQERRRAAERCERMAYIEAALARGEPILRHEEAREGALKAAVKLHETCKLNVAALEELGRTLERLRWILEAQRRHLDSDSPRQV